MIPANGGAQAALRALVADTGAVTSNVIERFLATTEELAGAPMKVTLSADRIAAGASGGIVLFELETPDPRYAGQYVLRYGASENPIFLQPSLAEHFAVLRAISDRGYPAPRGMWLDDGLMGLGPAMIMTRVNALPASIHYLAEGPYAEADSALRQRMIRNVVELAARLHALPLKELGLENLRSRGGSGHFIDREINWTQAELHARFPEVEPDDERAVLHRGMRSLLDEVAAWLRQHAPRHREPVLAHGDFTIANIMFEEDGHVAALIDWELCHEGLPEEDLMYAELSARGRRGVGAVDFPSRDELIAAYRKVRPLEDEDWDYAAVLSSFRITTWAAIGGRRLPRDAWPHQRSLWEKHSGFLRESLQTAQLGRSPS